MPQIPVFDDHVGVSAPGAARISPEAAAAPAMALVRAGSELSNVADRYAAHEREAEEKRKRAVQQAQASEAVTAASKSLRDLEFKYGQLNDRQAANDGFGKDAAALKKSSIDALKKDPEVQAFVSREIDRETLTRQDAATHSAWTNEIKYHRGRLIDDSHADAIAAAQASNDVERHMIMARREAAIDGAISAGFVDADDGARLKAGFNSEVSEASVDHIQNAIIQNKDTAAAKRFATALSDPKQFTDMDPLKREAKAEHAAIVANTLEAQDEARLRESQALARASAEAIYGDNLESLERTGMQAVPQSAGQIRALFPGAAGDRMVRRTQLAAGLYQATQKTALTSPQEDMALVDSLKPSGAGFADEARAQDILTQTLAKKYKAIEQDPAAYVLSTSPTIAALFQAGTKHPVQMGAAIAALNGAYDRMGVPPEARTVMPKPQAEHAVQAIIADPEKAPATMKALQAQYGAAYPQAFADLVRLGKMPGAYQAVGVLDNERDGGTLARWLADSKGKEAGDLLGETASDIKKAVRGDAGVQSLLQSLARSGSSNTQIGNVLDAIDTLGYAKSFYDSDPNAAQNAAKAFTDKWEFMANGGARVPRANYDAVTANAAATLSGLTLDKIAVPPVYGQQGMPKPEEFLQLLKASPSWITSPNANALWLMDAYGRLVRKKDGSPVSVPFDRAAPPPAAAQPGFEGLSTSPMGIE